MGKSRRRLAGRTRQRAQARIRTTERSRAGLALLDEPVLSHLLAGEPAPCEESPQEWERDAADAEEHEQTPALRLRQFFGARAPVLCVRLRWDAAVPSGTRIEVRTRSGNTGNPDSTWTDWSAPYARAEGDAVTSERSNCCQNVSCRRSSCGNCICQRQVPPDAKTIVFPRP